MPPLNANNRLSVVPVTMNHVSHWRGPTAPEWLSARGESGGAGVPGSNGRRPGAPRYAPATLKAFHARGPVLALAGRRVDATDAEVRRFPLENAPLVRQRLHALMAAYGASALVCSAAAGADLLALDAAVALGLRPRVVLPFARARFRDASVADRPGGFGPLFDRVLDVVEASGDLVLLEGERAPGDSYRACNEVILEEAAALAEPESPIAVVVWDGRSAGPDDNTDAFASAARGRGWTVVEVLTSQRAPAGSHRR